MRTTRKAKAVIEQIMEMKRQGHGFRAISRCLGVSRNTIKKIYNSGQSDQELEVRSGFSGPAWAQAVNWEKVNEDFKKGVTLKSLHQEWAPKEVCYSTFWHTYRQRKPKAPEVTMRLAHRPGEYTFFDFCDGIAIINRESGERTITHLLCGILPFSSYTYGEFVLNQKQPTLMGAIEKAWHYFGGVTPYVRVDNLKAGVNKAHIYDPIVNPGFVDFANHWGFAVTPARPYKPRDKAANESGIGVIQRTFFQEVRQRTFYSLAELNECLREFLTRLNSQVMKDHGVSRLDRFEGERARLKPLASAPYTVCEWRTAKVHADCHIQVERRFYSVPHAYVGHTVRIRLSERMVEVFSEDQQALAAHARLTGQSRVSTQESHYPEAKSGLTRFEVQHAKKEAEKIGPEIRALVDELLNQEYPLKYLRRIHGILRLFQSGQVDQPSLEFACRQGRLFKKTNYEYIKSAAKHFQIHGNRPVVAAPRRDPSEIYLHNHQS
jgi:transposase